MKLFNIWICLHLPWQKSLIKLGRLYNTCQVDGKHNVSHVQRSSSSIVITKQSYEEPSNSHFRASQGVVISALRRSYQNHIHPFLSTKEEKKKKKRKMHEKNLATPSK